MSLNTLNVLRAFELARTAHFGQKYGSEDYIWHPYRVALGFETPWDQVVSLLHDTVEDTGVTLVEIETLFGCEVAADINTLTRRKGEEYLSEYIPRVGKSPTARKVKIADLKENIRASLSGPEKYKGLLPRYRKALKYLVDLEEREPACEASSQL